MSEPSISVNGREVRLDSAPPQRTLQEFIRSSAAQTGTTGACGHGVCGACTVLLDGRPVRSCLILSTAVAGRSVVTVEGLDAVESRVAARLREAFLERNAFQCGYCTSGMLVLAFWWLTASADDRRACRDVSSLLETNLCRCTGYEGLRRAITAVHDELQCEQRD